MPFMWIHAVLALVDWDEFAIGSLHSSFISALLLFQDLAIAMKKLGLNPTETEIQDLINAVEVNGLVYYQDFCRIIVRKFREDDEENFHPGALQNSRGS
jgi:hypothetical protein